MRIVLLLASFLSVSAANSILPPVDPSTATELPINYVPGKFIVQFSQTGSSKYIKRDGSADITSFIRTLQSVGHTATPDITFNSTLFHGVSFQLSANETSISKIKALPEVKRIWPVQIYTLPPFSVEEAHAQLTSLPIWNPHNTTNVNIVHERGHLGRGVIVATVDSGVNYSMAALGGGFGPGFKVDGGYDFTGNDYTAGGTLAADNDPMDCLGHGTHVAGIIASSDPYLPGVAPEATLRSYKVFGCSDGASSDVVIAAFLRAYDEGADVINASLGSSQGFPDEATAVVTSMIQAAGVFVAVAAGNSGSARPFYTSNAANGVDVTAAGSVKHQSSPNVTGFLNSFTSWGPTLDSRMKPDISAPGGTINSTYKNGKWGILSGTSMASPYIAGVAALYFESHGGRQALGPDGSLLAHNIIQASGKPVLMQGSNVTAHVARQGSGMVDALKVVEYVTSISPSVLNLNDTTHFNPFHTVTITNSGNEAVTYNLHHEPGSLFSAKENIPKNDTSVSLTPIIYSGSQYTPDVRISDATITIAARTTGKFSVTFTEPATPDGVLLPVYGGAIIINGSNSESLRLSYMGIKGDLYSQNIWETNRGAPHFLDGSKGDEIQDGQNYTWGNARLPTPYFNVLWSTRELSFDVRKPLPKKSQLKLTTASQFVTRDWQPTDWAYPFIPGQNNYLGSIRQTPSRGGSVTDYPLSDLSRHSGGVYASPQDVFSNGETIPDGEYRILGRALRNFGDYNNLTDWQWKLSSWFTVVHKVPSNTTTSS
ncbi:hypothetical protein G7Y89_g9466 [Cudoniella acicularis]|uniref:Uncharacterized protein n=1 Tax=Cudoniella acicularis TaxID=354080 RepID=A0A8H4REL4_9HELO|nr:hypothetical protein G7Y89_g9466 [Cudoniella acicularis]